MSRWALVALVALGGLAALILVAALSERAYQTRSARPCAGFRAETREDVPARCFRDFDPDK